MRGLGTTFVPNRYLRDHSTFVKHAPPLKRAVVDSLSKLVSNLCNAVKPAKLMNL